MKRHSRMLYISFSLIPLLGACSQQPPASSASFISARASTSAPQSDRDAVIEAIQRHLSGNKGINMSAMDMNVGNVAIDADQAQADTEFRLKQGGTSMLIKYFLQRHPGGWIVIRNETSSAGQFAHPPIDKIHSGVAPAPSAFALPDLTDIPKRAPSQKPN